MSAPSTKAELLATVRRVRAEWNALMAAVGEARMGEPDVVGTWSVRDAIAHLSAYERWTAARLRADLDGVPATHRNLYGRDDSRPDDSGVDAYNAWHVAFNRERPLRDVLADNERAYQSMLAVIERMDERELRDPQRFAWLPAKSLWQILPNQSYNHYRMHLPAIRAWLNQQDA